MASKNKFEQWAEAKFQGLTKAELREAGVIFGCTFGADADEKVMRIKLCEKIGEAPMKEPAPMPKSEGRKPNLTPQGIWGGQRQRVILSRAPHEMAHKSKALTWEGVTRTFPYDELVDMPNPWFNIMKDAVSAHVTQHRVLNEEGDLTGMERREVPFAMHNFRHIGVTPGTENLPGDLLDYWNAEAKRTNYFANYSRSALIAIRTDFVGSVGMNFYKDLTTEEIRFDVLRKCNLEDAVLEIEEKKEAEAQAA